MVQEFTKEEKETIVNGIINSYRKKFIRKIEQDKTRYYNEYENSSVIYDRLNELKTYLDVQDGGSEFKTTMKKIFAEVADFLDSDRVEEPMLTFTDNDSSLCVSFKYKLIIPIKGVKDFIIHTSRSNYNSTSNYTKLYEFINKLEENEQNLDGCFVTVSMPLSFCLRTTLLNKSQTNIVMGGITQRNIGGISDREIDRMLNRDNNGDAIPMFFLSSNTINIGYSGLSIASLLNSTSRKQDMTFSTFIETVLNEIEERIYNPNYDISRIVMGWSDSFYEPELIKREEE